MSFTILLIGVMYVLFGLVLLIKPKILLDWAKDYSERFGFQLGAAILGVAIGILFFLGAGVSKFPGFFEFIGIMALGGGVISIFLPPGNFKRLIAWELRIFSPYTLPLGLVEVAFGAFLIYAV
jgi:hypothetical protein